MRQAESRVTYYYYQFCSLGMCSFLFHCLLPVDLLFSIFIRFCFVAVCTPYFGTALSQYYHHNMCILYYVCLCLSILNLIRETSVIHASKCTQKCYFCVVSSRWTLKSFKIWFMGGHKWICTKYLALALSFLLFLG